MDSIKEDIHSELRRLRLDKTHLYTTLLKIIDAIPQAEAQAEPLAEVPVVEPAPVVEAPAVEDQVDEAPVEKVEPEAPPSTPVKKTGGRKKKITVEA